MGNVQPKPLTPERCAEIEKLLTKDRQCAYTMAMILPAHGYSHNQRRRKMQNFRDTDNRNQSERIRELEEQQWQATIREPRWTMAHESQLESIR